MLENEETALFSDISAEILGVSLEWDIAQNLSTAVEDESEPEFIERANAVLDNATIDVSVHMRVELDTLGMVRANSNEVTYQVDLGQVNNF